MKKISLLLPLVVYTLAGCGSASVSSGNPTNFSRSTGSELHLKDLKEHYYIGEDYNDNVKAVDEYGTDISQWVVIEGEVDTSIEGKYVVVYKLVDSKGQVLDSVEKEITVTRNQAPVITLYGEQQFYLYLNYTYDEPGFEAIDSEDGDISRQIQVAGNIDNTQEGTYTLIYSVTDSFGNKSSAQRIVHVIPMDDIRPRVIEPDSGTSLTVYNLWDYMVNKSDTQYRYTSYINNLKQHSQNDHLQQISIDTYRISFPYTLRTLSYKKNDDATLTINFQQENDILKSVLLKDSVHIDEVITQYIPQDSTKSCKFLTHYNAIQLADKTYYDVIKIGCGNTEAYFEKDKGIILQNMIVSKETSLETNSINEDIVLKTITQETKIPLGELNLESMQQSHTDMLASAPYNLHGSGMKVGIVDEGAVRSSHIEIANRVTNLTTVDVSDHTTHVAGTIAATGINKDARGYANQVEVEVLSYNEDSMYFSYAMDAFRLRGVYISNHSYGEGNYTKAGVYGDLSHKADKLVATYQNVIAIASAGNDRQAEGYGDYGNIKDFSNAKNVITVGAVNYDGTITEFSSTGPVKNGRIKPDIVAKGYMVMSLDTKSDDGYIYMHGTSMAAPAVTGAMVLLQEEYLKINHEKMREDSAKAIITNTAEDLGRSGPDYEYGFGLLNTLEAVQVIDSMKTGNSLVQLKDIAAEQKHTYDLHIDALTTFKATLCWIDPESAFVPTGVLASDLDLTIVDADFHTVYAFSLDADNPESVATQEEFNRVDNVEQIVTKLPKGDYKVIVTVHRAGKAQQKYTLVSNVALHNFTVDSSYSQIHEFETKIYESVAQQYH